MNEFTKEIYKKKQEDKEKQIEKQKENLKQAILMGEQLTAMRQSPGWKLVEDYLTKELDIAMNQLSVAEKERDIFYNQAQVYVIRKLLQKIGVQFKIASEASELLKMYEK
jgi:hypothetical protein